MFFDIKHTRRTHRSRCQPGEKTIKTRWKKSCDTSIACCNVAHIFGSIFHVNAIKVRFCSWKNTKRKCIKQTCTKNRLQLLLVTAFHVATKAGVKYRKFNLYCIRAWRKLNLKVAKNHFSYSCYSNLQWLAVVCLLWHSHYAECRMHLRIAVACQSIKCNPN